MKNAPSDGDARTGESSLGEIVHELENIDNERVTINEILRTFEDRSSGVLITLLGLIASLPMIGAVPGISITVGVLILLILARSALGAPSIKLPERMGRLGLKRDRFRSGLKEGRKLAGWLDRLLRERFTVFVVSGPSRLAIKACVAFLAISMFPLAFVPWGVTPPAFGIVAFGLALIARDGVFATAGYAFCAATIATALWLL